MKKHKDLILCIFCVMLSIVTFVLAHIVFGTEYVLDYYISVFIVSIIPLWIICYCFLRRIYKYYYSSCIIKIFEIADNEDVIDRIFALNVTNVVITLGIALFIFSCYVYFGENGIIMLPKGKESYVALICY